MLTIDEATKLSDPEKLINELKNHVRVRDQVGGALYWNVLNDECVRIANKCLSLGANREEISNILGFGAHY